jgi:predicted kinase
LRQSLIVFSGACGSGKTTAAMVESQKRFGCFLLSRDDVRGEHGICDEAELSKQLIKQASYWLAAGFSCIVDACNLHEHDRIRWETLALAFDVELDWRHLPTAVDVCVVRDAMRPTPVGESFIRGQFL